MKTIKCGTLVGLILVSVVTQAEWLCTEASSTKTGSTITSCGVGKSQNIEEARNLAREQAINEFNQLCKISADCSQFDYNVVPKRTDCQIKGSDIICYRAIDFEITQNLKKDASINKDDLQKDLSKTRDQIDELQSKIFQARQLQAAQYEVELRQRQLKRLEARDIKLASISKEDEMSPSSYSFYSNHNDDAIKFGVSYWDGKLTSSSEVDMALSISYEHKAFSWLGLQLEFSHGGDMGATNSDHTSGTANTTQSFQGSQTYNTLSASGLIYTGISRTYIRGEVGTVLATRTIDTVKYSAMGTGVSEKNNTTISKSFQGVSLGYDSRDNNKGWGTYVEIGARSTGSSVGLTTSVGLSVGF